MGKPVDLGIAVGRRAAVLKVLDGAGAPLSTREVTTATGIHGKNAHYALNSTAQVLRRLETAGLVRPAGWARAEYHGVPVRTWEITGAGQEYPARLEREQREAEAERQRRALAANQGACGKCGAPVTRPGPGKRIPPLCGDCLRPVPRYCECGAEIPRGRGRRPRRCPACRQAEAGARAARMAARNAVPLSPATQRRGGNRDRIAAAGDRDAHRAALALDVIADGLSNRERAVAGLRAAYPDKSWREIGEVMGATKDAVTGTWRRLMTRAARLPGWEAALEWSPPPGVNPPCWCGKLDGPLECPRHNEVEFHGWAEDNPEQAGTGQAAVSAAWMDEWLDRFERENSLPSRKAG